jgi:branched-chain amino acid transport system permease protein
MTRFLWPAVSLIVLLALAVLAAQFSGSTGLSHTATEALVMLVVVIGLYVFIGNSGILAFGHIGFMAVGAYATAWQTCCPELKAFTMNGLPDFLLHETYPVFQAAIASAAVAAALAFVSGLAIMRLSGVAASIATLATLFIVHVTYSNWESVTRGKGSLVGLPTYVGPWVAFGYAAVAILIAYLYQVSRSGLALRASREDEPAALAAGVNVYLHRLIAFTLSGFIVGLGGVLHGHYLGAIQIDNYFLDMTLIAMAMLVVGGLRSLAGAVTGVVVLSTLIEAFRQLENGVTILGARVALPSGVQQLSLAIAMLMILALRPQGLTAGREIAWPFREPRAAPESMPNPRAEPAGPPLSNSEGG